MISKKGVSDVIATVLILLLTVASVGILVAVVIPFVQNNLEESTTCLDVRGGITIVGEDSCYMPDDDTNLEIRTEVKVKVGNVDIDGIYLVLEDGNAASTSYEISEEITISGLNDGEPLSLPQEGGGEKLYETLSGTFYREVSVGGIIDGKRCPNPDERKLELCLD